MEKYSLITITKYCSAMLSCYIKENTHNTTMEGCTIWQKSYGFILLYNGWVAHSVTYGQSIYKYTGNTVTRRISCKAIILSIKPCNDLQFSRKSIDLYFPGKVTGVMCCWAVQGNDIIEGECHYLPGNNHLPFTHIIVIKRCRMTNMLLLK